MLFFLVFYLSSCATPYHKESFFSLLGGGGYYENNSIGGLIKVGFDGNADTSNSLFKKYILIRCAEIGKEKRKPYFAIYTSVISAIDEDKLTEPPIYQSFGVPSSYVYVAYHQKQEKGDLSVNEIYQQYGQKANQ